MTAAGQYGTSVGLAGSIAAVGSPAANRVDVFYCSGSSRGLIIPDITSGNGAFGSSVAIVQPDLLLVGAPNQTNLACTIVAGAGVWGTNPCNPV